METIKNIFTFMLAVFWFGPAVVAIYAVVSGIWREKNMYR